MFFPQRRDAEEEWASSSIVHELTIRVDIESFGTT